MEITVFAGKYGEAPALKKEHALGLFISTAEHNCMFDFGDKTAAGNLAALEIAPETADAAILSHGHLGAGGGLLALRPIISKNRAGITRRCRCRKRCRGKGFCLRKAF